jgi:hypothetical protein
VPAELVEALDDPSIATRDIGGATVLRAHLRGIRLTAAGEIPAG